ncbi:unnamed protein product [Meganyctiphanes norvegica]|uniref:Uncharacterized protein n=1 Tax=Meganyctiphanes norvegica TaxID=48144 RepID=A0AAV2QC65_MEGNR
MMRSLLFVTLLSAMALSSAQKRGNFEYLTMDNVNWLISERKNVDDMVNCVKRDRNCNDIFNDLKRIMPEILRTKGSCRAIRCTAEQQEVIKYAIKQLNKRYPRKMVELQSVFRR